MHIPIYTNPKQVIRGIKIRSIISKIFACFATIFFVFILLLMLLKPENINKIAIVPFILVSVFIGYIYKHFYCLFSYRTPLSVILIENNIQIICAAKKYNFNR